MIRRTLTGLILSTLAATAVAVAVQAPAAHAACTSIPANHDPAVIVMVYRTARSLNVNDKVMLSGFEAGWVESHMNNLPCGDKSSLGVFQQRWDYGWGTPSRSWTSSTPPRSTSAGRSAAPATTPATGPARSPSACSAPASPTATTRSRARPARCGPKPGASPRRPPTPPPTSPATAATTS
ncbi:hypothetical protein ACFQZ4_38685 [Catellatospora coxensis]